MSRTTVWFDPTSLVKRRKLKNGLLRSVDNSEAAFLAEDFPGSRWSYQCKAVAAIAESLALFSGAQLAGSPGSRASPQHLCIVACGARPSLVHPPCPLADTRSALAALQQQQHAAEGGQQDLGAALRLAAVGPTEPAVHIAVLFNVF